MGAPTGSFGTYSQVGIREDLSNVIYDISPMDTYFTSNIRKTDATNTLHDWQTDALDAPVATNAWVEGDDFSAGTINATTKLRNYTQIARKDFVTTRTGNLVNTAGRAKEHAYQKVRKGMALRRDIETQVLRNSAATAGAAASARVSASVETWIYTNNHIKLTGDTTGTTPAPVSGIASAAPTDGTAAALTAAALNSALQQAWSCGGVTDVILVGPTLKNKIADFSKLATPYRNVGAGEQVDIVAAADVYVSDFGSHKIVLSRYMRNSVVLCLDTSTWALAWLDKMHAEGIAKSGDSEKTMIVAEYSLEARSPTGNSKIANAT